jgi:ribosomal protein S18 acetylase RimI-like enzyme
MNENAAINRETILSLVSAISPSASDYVERNFSDAIVLYAKISKDGQGVFLKVPSEDLCVYYACFPDDSDSELPDIINKELGYAAKTQAELCFNVYGKNRNIIDLVRSKGYAPDMEGYVLKYSGPTPLAVDMGELETGVFLPSMCGDFVGLFEAAYEQLNLENGWDNKSYSRNAEQFCRRLGELYERQSMQLFMYRGALVGCYIIEGSYISDIVVHPGFQGKGYGSLMLKHCIRHMRENKGTSDIYLRVAISNLGAKRLYERNGFQVISHFAEHTYKRS